MGCYISLAVPCKSIASGERSAELQTDRGLNPGTSGTPDRPIPFLPVQSTPISRSVAAFATLSLLMALLTVGNVICNAQTIPPGVTKTASLVTQRRINDWAASLEQVRFMLVEDTGLRRPNETLHVYLYRLAQPLPAETPAQYAARIDKYLAAFTQASAATIAARRMPILRDNRADNQRLWQRVVRSITLLPARIRKMQTVWSRTRKFLLSGSSGTKQNRISSYNGVNSAAIGSELEQTLDVVIEARSALRDARP